MDNNDKLRHEITKRWWLVRTDAVAHAQLEYILSEAGLLTKPRKRKAKEKPAEGILNLEQQ